MTPSTNPVRLQGWALVLGASSGFGAATARALAGSGLDIFGVHLDRRATLPSAERVIAGIEALGRRAVFFNVNAADDAKRAEVVAAMEQTLKSTGTLGALRVLLHSLAFGTLKLMAGGEAKDVASRAQIDMTLEERAKMLQRHTRRFTEEEIKQKFSKTK